MTDRLTAAAPSGLLLVSLGGALLLRVLMAGNGGAASIPAGLVFAAALLYLAVTSGWRPARPHLLSIAIGLAGAAVLLAVPVWQRVEMPQEAIALPPSAFPLWGIGVTLVAVAEEVFLRGALFHLVERMAGTLAAVALTAIAFALIHVPLYGPSVLPLDLAVGVWLSGLRVLTGGIAAPATAHAVADLAVWWLL
jgi:membrane protease YdiL (CAAX protease family)